MKLIVPIENIHLDPNNPRLPEEFQNKSQKELLDILYKYFALRELAESMARNGYFEEEPLVVIPTDDGGIDLTPKMAQANSDSVADLSKDNLDIKMADDAPTMADDSVTSVSSYIGDESEADPPYSETTVRETIDYDSHTITIERDTDDGVNSSRTSLTFQEDNGDLLDDFQSYLEANPGVAQQIYGDNPPELSPEQDDRNWFGDMVHAWADIDRDIGAAVDDFKSEHPVIASYINAGMRGAELGGEAAAVVAACGGPQALTPVCWGTAALVTANETGGAEKAKEGASFLIAKGFKAGGADAADAREVAPGIADLIWEKTSKGPESAKHH